MSYPQGLPESLPPTPCPCYFFHSYVPGIIIDIGGRDGHLDPILQRDLLHGPYVCAHLESGSAQGFVQVDPFAGSALLRREFGDPVGGLAEDHQSPFIWAVCSHPEEAPVPKMVEAQGRNFRKEIY